MALRAGGLGPLIDRSEIYAFEDWWKRIQGLISQADTIIFVLSPDAVASDVCRREVAFAASLNKRFAPIVWRPVDFASVPSELSRLNYILFDTPSHFEQCLGRLVEALVTDFDWVRRHTEFGQMAAQWEGAKRAGGFYLRSPLLEEAERWIASRPNDAPEPTAITRNFIAASRKATTLRRNILTGGLAVGLVLALALAGIAYWQRGLALQSDQRAREQRDEALLTRSSQG